MCGYLVRLASQWIAGETVEEALERAKQANSRRLGAILNILGEHLEAKEEAEESTRDYLTLLSQMKQAGVSGSVSVKLTQLGLAFDGELCLQNVRRISDGAKRAEIFLWLDMEGSRFTQKTLDIYTELLSLNRNTGVAIQAYLKRSEQDIRLILERNGKIRLCKGAYMEPASIAYTSRREVSASFEKLMQQILKQRGDLAVATHDEELVRKTVDLIKVHGVNPEFQMLMGVRVNRQLELAAQGFKVSQYVPFGRNWLPYSLRRLRERKRNILLMARSLITG